MVPDIGLAKGTRTLWQEELLLDYTIEVEDEKFRVHKVTIASVSDYFKVMLTGGLAESQTDRVRLEGLSSLVVSSMIDFIYTGEFGCPKAGTEDLLGAAVYLQIQSAIKACTDLLYDEVNVENCLHILSTFKTYTVEDGIKRTTRYIQSNMDDILQTCKPDEMSCEKFVNLMECWGRSEWDLVNTTIQWLNVDFEQRKTHINEIMSHVRFMLLSPAEVAKLKDTDLFSDCEGPWRDCVEKALRYHTLPMHQQVLDDTEQIQVRNEPAPVVFTLDDDECLEDIYALHKEKSWELCDSFSAPQLACPPTVVLEVNNFLILCDRYGTDWHIFDPRTFCWSTMAPMDKPRCGFGLVCHQRHLYALGGTILVDDEEVVTEDEDPSTQNITDLIEKYDFETNTWSIIGSKLCEPLTHHGAFSIGDCIYVTFGWIDDEMISTCYSRVVTCLDVVKDTWSTKAPFSGFPMLRGTRLVELAGEKVIAGFDLDFRLHYLKPSTDQWLVYNPSPPTALKWHNGNEVLARGNCVYLLDLLCIRAEQTKLTSEIKLGRGTCEKWILEEKEPSIDKSLDILPVFRDSTFAPGVPVLRITLTAMTSKRMDIGLAPGVLDLWKQKLLLDYTIEVEGREFKVHKFVLLAVSEYFQRLLGGSFKESTTDRVELKELSAETVSKTIEFVYTGDEQIIDANLAEIYKCAVYLQMQKVIEVCIAKKLLDLNVKNCIEFLSTCISFSFSEGIEKVKGFIKSHWKSVFDGCQHEELPHGCVQVIIEFWGKSEWELVLYIKNWVYANCEKRKLCVNDLMSQVRFCLLSPAEVSAAKELNIYSQCKGSWHRLVDQAVEYHTLPVHKKVVDHSKQAQVRSMGSLVLFSTSDDLSTFFALGKDSWNKSEASNAPKTTSKQLTFVEVNNFLFVCVNRSCGENWHQEWHVFDPRTLTWSQITSMETPRGNFALVNHNDHLYALGGCEGPMASYGSFQGSVTDTTEVYDIKTNTWCSFQKMPAPVQEHSACVFRDAIYVSGGSQHGLHINTQMICFDLSTSTWQKKAPMSRGRIKHQMGVMSLKEEVIVVVDRWFVIEYYKPQSDQWTVFERVYSHKEIKKLEIGFNSTILIQGNSVYLLDIFGRCYWDWDHSSGPESDDDAHMPYYDSDDSPQQKQERACVEWQVLKYREAIRETILPEIEWLDGMQAFGAVLSVPPSSLLQELDKGQDKA